MKLEDRVEELESQVELLRLTLGTLMRWMSGTAGSPLSRDNWEELMDMMPSKANKR